MRAVLFRIRAEKGRNAMFCIGERICYPMHGIGEIEGIEQRRVLGVNAQYYLLKFDSGRVSAMVPVETAEKIGLRRLISRKEGDKVLRYILSGGAHMEATQSENWNPATAKTATDYETATFMPLRTFSFALPYGSRKRA